MMLHIFSFAIFHLYVFLEGLCLDPLPILKIGFFFYLAVEFRQFSAYFEYKFFLDMCFASIFSKFWFASSLKKILN